MKSLLWWIFYLQSPWLQSRYIYLRIAVVSFSAVVTLWSNTSANLLPVVIEVHAPCNWCTIAFSSNSVHAFIAVSCICYCRSFRKIYFLHHLLHVTNHPLICLKLGMKEWMCIFTKSHLTPYVCPQLFPILSTVESFAGCLDFFFFFFWSGIRPRFLLFLQNAPFGFM